MGLKCKIELGPNQLPVAVTEQGNVSPLFKGFLKMFSDLDAPQQHNKAIVYWTAASDERFQEYTGKNEDTAVVEDVIAYVQAKNMFDNELSAAEELEIKKMMSAMGVRSLGELAQKLATIFPAGKINTKAAIESGIYTQEDIKALEIGKIIPVLDRIYGSIMKDKDFDVESKDTIETYRNSQEKSILGTSSIVTLSEVQEQLLKQVSDPRDTNEIERVLSEMPFDEIYDKFKEDQEFAKSFLEFFEGLRKIEVSSIVGGELVVESKRKVTMRNTLPIPETTLPFKAILEYLANIPDVVFTTSLPQVKEILTKVEEDFAEMGVDVVGLKDLQNQGQIMEVLDTAIQALEQGQPDMLSEKLDEVFGEQDNTVIKRIDNEFDDITLVVLNTTLSPLEVFKRFGLIKLHSNVYQKISTTEDLQNAYDLLTERVQQGELEIPSPHKTYTSKKDTATIQENLKTWMKTKDTGLNFKDERTSLYQAVFKHKPLRDTTSKDILLLDSVNTRDEAYLTQDFISDFYSYILKEKVKDSNLYKDVLSKFDVTDNEITLNGDLISLDGIEFKQTLEDYIRLSKNTSLKHLVSKKGETQNNSTLTALNNKEAIGEYNQPMRKEGNYIVTKPNTAEYIRKGQDVYEKVAQNKNGSVYGLVSTRENSNFYTTKYKVANDKKETERLLRTADLLFKDTETFSQKEEKAGMLTPFFQNLKRKAEGVFQVGQTQEPVGQKPQLQPSGYQPSDNLIIKPELARNTTIAWRTMGASEFNDLIKGNKAYQGGTPSAGNWFAAVPQTAAKFGGLNKILVEFSNVQIQGGENLVEGTTAGRDNVTNVWRFSLEHYKYKPAPDLLERIKNGDFLENIEERDPEKEAAQLEQEFNRIYGQVLPNLREEFLKGDVDDTYTLLDAYDMDFDTFVRFLEGTPSKREQESDEYANFISNLNILKDAGYSIISEKQKEILREYKKENKKASEMEDKVYNIRENPSDFPIKEAFPEPSPPQFQQTDRMEDVIGLEETKQIIQKLKESGLSNNTYILTPQQLQDKLQEIGITDPNIQRQIIAWHGSPHSFEKFTTEAMGTGEGVQAFGWGLYFTDLESIARAYAKNLSTLKFKGEDIFKSEFFDILFRDLDASNSDFYDYQNGRIFNMKNFKNYIDDQVSYLSSLEINEQSPLVKRLLQDYEYREEKINEAKNNLKLTKDSDIENISLNLQNAGIDEKTAKNIAEDFKRNRQADKTYLKNAIRYLANRDTIIKTIVDGEKTRLKSSLNYFKFLQKNFDKFEMTRNLYKVSLHQGKTPSEYTWLEWDKPVSEETLSLFRVSKDNIRIFGKELDGTSEYLEKRSDGWYFVREEYDSFDETSTVDLEKYMSKELTGGTFYEILRSKYGSTKEASMTLLERGIDGVKYPAESIARGATSDTARGFNYVVFDENAITIEEQIQFQKQLAENGISLTTTGFVYKGDVYLNEATLNPETAIHEFNHIFTDWMKTNRPEIFNRGLELVNKEISKKKSEIQDTIDFVRRNQPNLTGENFALEVLTQLVGERGQSILESKKNTGLKSWLQDLWEQIKEMLGILDITPQQLSKLTIQEYADKMAIQLLKGEDITKMGTVAQNYFTRNADRLPLTLSIFNRPEFVAMQGKMVNPITVLNSLNQSGIKQIEKDMIKNIIETEYQGQKKIDYDELEALVRANIMPLERIFTSAYADYGMDNLGDGNYGEANTIILNSPIEHGVTGHFPGAFKASGRKNIKYVPKQLNDNTWVAVEEGYEAQANNNNIYQFVGTAGTKEAVDAWIESYGRTTDNKVNIRNSNVVKVVDEFDPTNEVYILKGESNSNILRRNVPDVPFTDLEDVHKYMIEQLKENFVEDLPINKGMFGHIRVWQDGQDFYAAEMQSDYFQKQYVVEDMTQQIVNSDKYSFTADQKSEYNAIFRDMVKYRQTYFNQRDYIKDRYENNLSKATKEELEAFEMYKKNYEEKKAQYDKTVVSKAKPLFEKDQKQFIASQKIWEQRMVREAIKEASLSGATSLMFPTPHTLSVIEGYIRGNEASETAPYTVVKGNTNRLEEGDIINYLGKEYIIVEANDSAITIVYQEDDLTQEIASDIILQKGTEQFTEENKINDDRYIYRGFYTGVKGVLYVEKVKKPEDYDTNESYFENSVFESQQLTRASYFEKYREKIETVVGKMSDTEFLEFTEDSETQQQENVNLSLDSASKAFNGDFKLPDYTPSIQEMTENIGEYTNNYKIINGKIYSTESSERLRQPNKYTTQKSEGFDIMTMLSEEEQTVARKYEEIAKILQDERGDNFEVTTDKNGFDWYKTKITQEESQNPVVAFQIIGEKGAAQQFAFVQKSIESQSLEKDFIQNSGFTLLSLAENQEGLINEFDNCD